MVGNWLPAGKAGGAAMKLQLVQTRKHGLEVWQVWESRRMVYQAMSEALARTEFNKRKQAAPAV